MLTPKKDIKQNEVYQQFRYLYQNYMQFNAERLAEIYSDQVVFKDPVHEVRGLNALQHYFADISNNLNSCHFLFIDEIVTTDCAHITWEMQFSHPKLRAGKAMTLRGMSFIRYTDKITYHEDAYDMGAMLYEHLPVLGKLTKWIKNKLAA
jgi:ketosteroid isomerase-like protein